jgi:protein KTI12
MRPATDTSADGTEVHIGTPAEKCREINQRLLADSETDGGYEEEDFENLIFRYEEPNGMTRWDSPLFTVLDDDATPPLDLIWEALIGSDGKAKVVRSHQATVLVRPSHFHLSFPLQLTTTVRNRRPSKTTSTSSTKLHPTSSRKS